MSERIELYKQFGQRQENYTYYIIALSIAAIGYSIHQTSGKAFEKSQIILALAVLCWSLSVYLGLRFLKLILSTIYTNMSVLDIKSGTDPLAENHPQKVAIGQEVLTKIINANLEKAPKLFTWQNRLFHAGIVVYMLWHLYGMYIESACKQ